VYLRGLDHLIDLGLSGTKVTKQGVDELRQALPKPLIFWEE
jgi:hypothetical protein